MQTPVYHYLKVLYSHPATKLVLFSLGFKQRELRYSWQYLLSCLRTETVSSGSAKLTVYCYSYDLSQQ